MKYYEGSAGRVYSIDSTCLTRKGLDEYEATLLKTYKLVKVLDGDRY